MEVSALCVLHGRLDRPCPPPSLSSLWDGRLDGVCLLLACLPLLPQATGPLLEAAYESAVQTADP